jgi:hypothetical protein
MVNEYSNTVMDSSPAHGHTGKCPLLHHVARAAAYRRFARGTRAGSGSSPESSSLAESSLESSSLAMELACCTGGGEGEAGGEGGGACGLLLGQNRAPVLVAVSVTGIDGVA